MNKKDDFCISICSFLTGFFILFIMAGEGYSPRVKKEKRKKAEK